MQNNLQRSKNKKRKTNDKRGTVDIQTFFVTLNGLTQIHPCSYWTISSRIECQPSLKKKVLVYLYCSISSFENTLLVLKSYKIQLPVLSFRVLLFQSSFTTFQNFSQHYLKNGFHQNFSFLNRIQRTPSSTAKFCLV